MQKKRAITAWIVAFLFLLLTIPSLILNAVLLKKQVPVQQNNPADPGVAVEGVIDGDTIVVEPKTRVRLQNIDAPE